VSTNARDIAADLAWLESCLAARVKAYFADVAPEFEAPPDLSDGKSPWARFLRDNEASVADRFLLLLALAPNVRPQLFDPLLARNDDTQRGMTEFGGVLAGAHGGFLPTGETALFLLAGGDLAQRFAAQRLFDPRHWLFREGALSLSPAPIGELRFAGVLALDNDLLDRFTSGELREPSFGADFPARRVETAHVWSDLVLPAQALAQLEEVETWLVYGGALLGDWGMAGKTRPGYTALFHGPPGTGKTMAACLLGQRTERAVYRLDLSLVVSKYIGETEKNLARVFDLAERRAWILFFDEADALFGLRTRVDQAHDRFANQEVSYLLQRLETFSGVAVLASNLKANIDPAFLRRFESVIEFALPGPAERLRIWRASFSARATLAHDVDLAHLARRFEIAGGAIANAVRFASLAALARKQATIRGLDLEEGVRRELAKEGRTS
jgi:ATPase family associated with various cellular activities (AAA)